MFRVWVSHRVLIVPSYECLESASPKVGNYMTPPGPEIRGLFTMSVGKIAIWLLANASAVFLSPCASFDSGTSCCRKTDSVPDACQKSARAKVLVTRPGPDAVKRSYGAHVTYSPSVCISRLKILFTFPCQLGGKVSQKKRPCSEKRVPCA